MEMESGKEILVNQTNIKEVMQMIKNADMEFLLGQVEMYIKATILMMSGMVLDKCIGMMEVAIKEIGKKVFNMVKVIVF
jgi:hypothetical protein